MLSAYMYRCFRLCIQCWPGAGVAAGKGVGRMAAHIVSFESLHVLQPAEQTGAGELHMYITVRQVMMPSDKIKWSHLLEGRAETTVAYSSS